MVAVQGSSGQDGDTQGWMDIGALLEEFREGLKGQVADNDVQAHYDLGISHMEMELFEEIRRLTGVEFEYTGVSAAVPAIAVDPATSSLLPAQLRVRIRDAVEGGYAKMVEHCLTGFLQFKPVVFKASYWSIQP